MQKNYNNIALNWTSPHNRVLPNSSKSPIVMGILNVSTDSFSDGGKYIAENSALAQVEKMLIEGATIIDIGAESTRPNATLLSEQEELALLLPKLQQIRKSFPDIAISVDTYKPNVAKIAIENGADIINDVLVEVVDNKYIMAKVAADLKAPLIITHNSRNENFEGDFFENLKSGISEKINLALAEGVEKSQIIIDTGVGFGKTHAQNHEMIARLAELYELDYPILLGVSRKSSLVEIVGKSISARDDATATISALSTFAKSANIFRVHDVAKNINAIKTTLEILKWTKYL